MKKGLKITLIVILSLIVVAGATLGIAYAVNADYVKNTFAMMTKNDTEYFKWVSQKNVDKALENRKEIMLTEMSNEQTDRAMTASSDITVEIGDELLKLLGTMNRDLTLPKSLKPIGIKSVFAVGNGDSGSSVTLKYNNVDLIGLDTLLKLNDKEAYVAIPTYKSDVIDLTGLARTDLSQYFKADEINQELKNAGVDITVADSDLKDIFAVINKIMEVEGETSGQYRTKEYIEESMEILSREFGIVVNEVEDASLVKNTSVSVNGVEAECNELTVKLSKKDILKIVRNYLNAREDGLKRRLVNLAKLPAEQVDKMISQIKEKIDELDSNKDVNFSADLILYVNNKGEYIGANVKFGVSGVKIGLKFVTAEEDKDTLKTGIEISVLGMRVADGTMTRTVNGTEKNTVLSLKLAESVGALVEGIGNYSIKIECTTDDGDPKAKKSSVELSVKDGTEAMGTIKCVNVINTEEAIMPIKTSGVNVIPYDKLLDTDYLSIKDLALYAIEKAEAVDDEYVDELVQDLVKQFLGAPLPYSMLKKTLQTMDFSEIEKQLKDSLKLQLNNGFDGSGTVAEAVPEPDIMDDDSLKVDVKEPHSYSKLSLSEYMKPFEYSDVDVEVTTVDYMQLEDAKKAFIDGKELTKCITSDANRQVGFMDDILFDAVPIMAGFPVTAYEYKNVPATVGDYQYGEGIDDQLVGMKVGENKLINLTLGPEFGDFAGYKGDFKITVSGIYDYVFPEWTEEYIVGVLGYESMDACEKEIIKTNGLQEVSLGKSMVFESAMFYIFDNFIDQEKLEAGYGEYAAKEIAFFDNQVKEAGLGESYKEYLKSIGLSEDDASSMIETNLREMFKTEIFIAYIAKKENIQVTLAEILDDLDVDVSEVKQSDYDAEMINGEEEFYNQAIIEKVYDTFFVRLIESKSK